MSNKFLGCSKGFEPSPTGPQPIMLAITPRATLVGIEMFYPRNCHFFNESRHGAKRTVTACVILMILSRLPMTFCSVSHHSYQSPTSNFSLADQEYMS